MLASARVPISWALRARVITGPSSALSVVVTFDFASSSKQNVTLEADRNGSPMAYQQTYATSQGVRPGVTPIHVRFYSQAGAQGSLVGAADASVLVKSDGTLAQANGSPLGTIQTTGQVASVSVIGPQSVTIGVPQPISTNVFDAQNDLIAVSSGSIFYDVTGGTGSATIDSSGNLEGVSPGGVSVIATVDGIPSAAATVTVLAPTLAMSSLTQATASLAVSPATGNVWATVPATDPTNGNSVIEIDHSTHKIVSTIPVGSSPTVMAFSQDGSALYVGLEGSDSFARVDPIGKKVLATYPLGQAGFGSSQYAAWITVQPGNPNVVALCQQDDVDSGFSSGCIYNNGVMLSSNMGIYNGEVLGFSNATTLWGSDPGFSPQGLFEGTVNATGATLTNTNRGLGGLFSVFGGNLYFTNGQVVSGTTGNLLGTFPVPQFGLGVAVDFTSETAYIVSNSVNGYQISSYDAANYVTITSYSLPSGPSAMNGFSLLSAGQLVFADGSNVYFVNLPSTPKIGNRSKRTKP